jgi:hypothetical protein
MLLVCVFVCVLYWYFGPSNRISNKQTKQTTPFSRVPHDELIISERIKKFQSFMEPEGPLLGSQKSVTKSCPVSGESSPQLHALFL